MKVSVFISFSGTETPNDNLRNTLVALRQQTLQPHEIVVATNCNEVDTYRAHKWCEENDATQWAFPDSSYAYVYSGNYNECFLQSSGEAILLLCSNWLLAPNWLQRMAGWLEELGLGNLVTTDNDRRMMPRKEGGDPLDWFAGMPDRFQLHDPFYLDNVKCLFYRQDWVPFDEDFDPPLDNSQRLCGNMHALILWGCHMLVNQKVKMWVARDMEMEHQYAPRTSSEIDIRNVQEKWSRRIFESKVSIRPMPVDASRVIAVDFDGTIHQKSNEPGYPIRNDPVEGAKEGVEELLLRGYQLVVSTARKDLEPVRDWLAKWEFPPLEVTNLKIPAMCYLDDYGVRFTSWESAVRDMDKYTSEALDEFGEVTN